MDEFQKLKELQAQASGMFEFEDNEFQALSPEKLRSMFDKEDNERLKIESFSLREVEVSGLVSSSSKKPDYSMGAYFQTRSSLPFPGLHDNVTLMDRHPNDLPEQDKSYNIDRNIVTAGSIQREVETATPSPFQGRGKMSTDSLYVSSKNTNRKSAPFKSLDTSREKMDTFGLSLDDPNASISSLANYFADPDKSPLSSNAIVDHVLQYCKHRSDTEGRKSKAIVHDILEKRRKSDTVENLDTMSKRLSHGHRRDSISYTIFRQDAADRLFPSRCSTPENSPTLQKSPSGSETVAISKPFASTAASTVVRQMPYIESQRSSLVPPSQHNRENTDPQPNSMVQLQINIPTSSVPSMPQLPGPIVINITCPNAPNPPSSISRAPAIETGSNSRYSSESTDRNCVVRSGNSIKPERQSTDPPSQPKLHIQLSGTFQWS